MQPFYQVLENGRRQAREHGKGQHKSWSKEQWNVRILVIEIKYTEQGNSKLRKQIVHEEWGLMEKEDSEVIDLENNILSELRTVSGSTNDSGRNCGSALGPMLAPCISPTGNLPSVLVLLVPYCQNMTMISELYSPILSPTLCNGSVLPCSWHKSKEQKRGGMGSKRKDRILDLVPLESTPSFPNTSPAPKPPDPLPFLVVWRVMKDPSLLLVYGHLSCPADGCGQRDVMGFWNITKHAKVIEKMQ